MISTPLLFTLADKASSVAQLTSGANVFGVYFQHFIQMFTFLQLEEKSTLKL